MKEFVQLAQWPAIFVLVALLTGDKLSSIVLILSLVFRRDLSAVLRQRRMAVAWGGFRGQVDGNLAQQVRRQKLPPS